VKKIFEVRSIARSDNKVMSWGARRTRAEAESLLAERTRDPAWANKHHSKWWIEEIDATGTFEIPSRPKPRERYSTSTEVVSNGQGYMSSLDVTVKDAAGNVAATYRRNHSGFYRTFEPFRQSGKMFALISTDYTATAVLDLTTGQVIASEQPHPNGFCPVGFYVPDWWDLHDDSILPGSMSWRADYEHPNGQFGFVWGCIWGDDTSWKVQYLDLSRIQDGVIRRDDRFGYLPLASHDALEAREFIEVSFWDGKPSVTFAVEQRFDLGTGQPLSADD
jgi:hypothetical protein